MSEKYLAFFLPSCLQATAPLYAPLILLVEECKRENTKPLENQWCQSNLEPTIIPFTHPQSNPMRKNKNATAPTGARRSTRRSTARVRVGDGVEDGQLGFRSKGVCVGRQLRALQHWASCRASREAWQDATGFWGRAKKRRQDVWRSKLTFNGLNMGIPQVLNTTSQKELQYSYCGNKAKIRSQLTGLCISGNFMISHAFFD